MALPKSWADITVKDFIQINSILANEDYESNMERMIDIALYFGKENEQIKNLSQLDFLMQPELMGSKVKQKFYFKGKLYRLNLNMNNLTAGQYIDLTTFTKKQEEIISNTHKIMAVISLPVNWLGNRKKYDGEAMLKRADEFLQLPITLVYPTTVFFCSNLENLMKGIEDYSLKQAEAKVRKLKKVALKMYGRGSLTSTR